MEKFKYSQAPGTIKIILIALVPQILLRILFYGDVVKTVGHLNQALGLIAEIALVVMIYKKISWTWIAGIFYSLFFAVFSLLAYGHREAILEQIKGHVLTTPGVEALPMEELEMILDMTVKSTFITMIVFYLIFAVIWWRSKSFFEESAVS